MTDNEGGSGGEKDGSKQELRCLQWWHEKLKIIMHTKPLTVMVRTKKNVDKGF